MYIIWVTLLLILSRPVLGKKIEKYLCNHIIKIDGQQGIFISIEFQIPGGLIYGVKMSTRLDMAIF